MGLNPLRTSGTGREPDDEASPDLISPENLQNLEAEEEEGEEPTRSSRFVGQEHVCAEHQAALEHL